MKVLAHEGAMINSALAGHKGGFMGSAHVIVDAYAGDKGEETPRSFTHGKMRRAVTEILDRWYTDSHCYFRVRTDDRQRYVLRHQLDEESWELVMQEHDQK